MTSLPSNVIELLKRHKASRDAGIISQEEFMDIYNRVINEDSRNNHQQSSPHFIPLSSSSSSSSITSQQPQSITAPIILKNKSNQALSSSPCPAIQNVNEDSSGGPVKVYN